LSRIVQACRLLTKDFQGRGKKDFAPPFSILLGMRGVASKGKGGMEYRCMATSLEGFVQQLASNILPHGYWFYVSGHVPEGKEPEAVDRKLIEKYGFGISRQQRARRKTSGLANLHYLRLERFWVLLGTHGHHPFFEAEAASIRDVRRIPIQVGGYSLSVKRGHFLKKEGEGEPIVDGRMRVRVQICRERYRELCAYFGSIACHRSAENLARELWHIPFEPYAPVRRQLLNLLRLINTKRQSAGYSKVPSNVLRYHRDIVKPFGKSGKGVRASAGNPQSPEETCKMPVETR
jgi:hypothetical protein